jgi:hypothetical protein
VLTWPLGLTVTVNVEAVPVQVNPALVTLGVTEIVAVIGSGPAFVAVKLMLPVPLAPNPMAVLLLVQSKTEPVTGPVNAIVLDEPLHIMLFDTVVNLGVGLTVRVNVVAVPVQVNPAPVYVGVTVIVAVAAVAPVFTAVKLAMSPVPLAAKPMEVLLFVQL